MRKQAQFSVSLSRISTSRHDVDSRDCQIHTPDTQSESMHAHTERSCGRLFASRLAIFDISADCAKRMNIAQVCFLGYRHATGYQRERMGLNLLRPSRARSPEGSVPKTRHAGVNAEHTQQGAPEPTCFSFSTPPSRNLLTLDGKQCMGDFSIAHLGVAKYLKSPSRVKKRQSTVNGAPGCRRCTQYRTNWNGCYRCTLLAVETRDRKGKSIMDISTDVASQIAVQGDRALLSTKFATNMLKEISVCLCKCNADLEHTVSCFTRVSLHRGL
jgi:hypothetical protein